MKKETRDILCYFKEHISRLKHLEKRVHAHPSEENIHDLRVEVRRILSLSRIFNLQKLSPLKDLSRDLGKLRDLDVGIKNARKFNLDSSQLVRDREGTRHEIVKFTGRKNRKELAFELKEARKHLKKKVLKKLRPIETDFFKAFQDKFSEDLTDANAHELRIFLKKARYFLEALKGPVEDMERLQDKLGDVHDLDVLMDFYGPLNEIKKEKGALLEEASRLKAGLLSPSAGKNQSL